MPEPNVNDMAAIKPKGVGTSVVPVLRYRDLPAAIDWLCDAFGFEKHRITTGKDGTVLFAQLTFGTAMVMAGPVRKSAFDKYLRQPDEIGGAETQVCYFSVTDARAHCARARAAGAEILFNVEDEVNGGHSYSCRDPEGHMWNFGTYNPWKPPGQDAGGGRRGRRWLGSAALCGIALGLAALVTALVLLWDSLPGPWQQMVRDAAGFAVADVSPEEGGPAREGALAQGQGDKDAAEPAKRADAGQQLAEARIALEAAQRAAKEVEGRLAHALGEKEAAEQAAREAQEQQLKAWAGRNAAERAAKEARRQLARERSIRRAAESTQPAVQPQSPSAMPRWQ